MDERLKVNSTIQCQMVRLKEINKREHKGKQRFCETCLCWCWKDDECNLFVASQPQNT